MITTLRMTSQQLLRPRFDRPKDLVAWMGAIQAQEYTMAKWAIGVRLQSGTLRAVEEALAKGEIIRTHLLRPTWHFVTAEDLPWIQQLCGPRIRAAYQSYARNLGITEELYLTCNRLIEQLIREKGHLTKLEIGTGLAEKGISFMPPHLNCFLFRAETDAIVCSGIDKNNKATYALWDERIPSTPPVTKEEALAKLATRYFQSHSPATLQDFTWWSGLSVTEARQAIGCIEDELMLEPFGSASFYIHKSCRSTYSDTPSASNAVFHFLPSYDEYLISYKDRSMAIDPVHYPKAFNRYGLFYPVILYKGQIVGNWNKAVKKGTVTVQTSFFQEKLRIPVALVKAAEHRYKTFIGE